MKVKLPVDVRRPASGVKVLVLWILASLIYAASVGYLNRQMFALTGLAAVFVVVVVRTRHTKPSISKPTSDSM